MGRRPCRGWRPPRMVGGGTARRRRALPSGVPRKLPLWRSSRDQASAGWAPTAIRIRAAAMRLFLVSSRCNGGRACFCLSLFFLLEFLCRVWRRTWPHCTSRGSVDGPAPAPRRGPRCPIWTVLAVSAAGSGRHRWGKCSSGPSASTCAVAACVAVAWRSRCLSLARCARCGSVKPGQPLTCPTLRRLTAPRWIREIKERIYSNKNTVRRKTARARQDRR